LADFIFRLVHIFTTFSYSQECENVIKLDYFLLITLFTVNDFWAVGGIRDFDWFIAIAASAVEDGEGSSSFYPISVATIEAISWDR